MMEDPGSFSGIFNSANPARGPQDISRMSLQILYSDTASVRSVPDSCTNASWAPCTVNLLGAVTKGRFGKARCRVDARSHGRTAQRQAVHALQGGFDAFQIVRQHPRIAGPFLAQRQRGGVLHVRAPDLDDLAPLLRLRTDGAAQGGDGGDETFLHVDSRRD